MVEFNKDDFEIVKDGNVATLQLKDDQAYFEKTEISKKVLKEVADYNADYVLGAATAIKNIGQEVMVEDNKIEKVNGYASYSPSKKGLVGVELKRKHTYKGNAMNGGVDIVKSTMKLSVANPFEKIGKTKIKELEKEMTEALLT